jgi:uncharacterized protein
MDAIDERYEELKSFIAGLGSVAVAFSSGVDSTLVLWAAHEALGEDAVAFTATSDIYPVYETEQAKAFCAEHDIPLVLLPLDPLALDGFADNPIDRCYRCKRMIFTGLLERAHADGLAEVVDGTNAEDAEHFRPGAKVLAEFGVISPLKELGMRKDEVRAISRRVGLPTWNKPAFACLMTRFGYGEHVGSRELAMVGAAEQVLIDEGFSQLRVRYHAGDVARIELAPEDFARMFADERNLRVEERLKDLGFAFVTMDLSGYAAGKMGAKEEAEAIEQEGGSE